MKLFCEPADAAKVAQFEAHFQLCPLPRNAWPDCSAAAVQGCWLQYLHGRVRLARSSDGNGVCVDPADVRRRAVRSSELAKACGLSGKRSANARQGAHTLSLLDGTCGWGVDGLSLALLGARVTLLERSLAVWALAADLISLVPDVEVQLVHADLWQWLQGQPAPSFDVVYLDPMFPLRKKTAAPGKRLQLLAALVAEQEANGTQPVVSEPESVEAWVRGVQSYARQRIVLKRRRNDAPLSVSPSWQIKGRSIRYDVYDPQRL